jgi:uncharacterized membrane protein YheB (UPF0754 family)
MHKAAGCAFPKASPRGTKPILRLFTLFRTPPDPNPRLHVIDKLGTYIRRHFQFEDALRFGEEALPPPAPRIRSKPWRAFALRLLKVIPWLCIAGFGASFFWDFPNGMALHLFGQTLPLQGLIKMVSVSGLIGYGTNYLAIKMLFKPRYRRPIWGQGLIPANKDRIAEKLAHGIHRNILNEAELQKRIHESGIAQRINQRLVEGTHSLLGDPEFQAEIQTALTQYLEGYFQREENRALIIEEVDKRIQEMMPKGVAGWVIRGNMRLYRDKYLETLDKAVQRFPHTLNQILDERVDWAASVQQTLVANAGKTEALIARALHNVVDSISIFSLVRSQLDRFDEGKLEDMIWGATNEHLLYIQYLGGWLGMLGGVLLWQPGPVSVFYGVLFGVLFVLDWVLMNAKTPRS